MDTTSGNTHSASKAKIDYDKDSEFKRKESKQDAADAKREAVRKNDLDAGDAKRAKRDAKYYAERAIIKCA